MAHGIALPSVIPIDYQEIPKEDSFHRLPLKDKRGLMSKWLSQIKRENLPQMKHCRVCFEHILKRVLKVSTVLKSEYRFESEYRLDLLPKTLSRRRLKEDAVPTLFKTQKS